MARALHTNLNAKFKCETLKLAVVKNKWLANRLGGDTFSIICKYESPMNKPDPDAIITTDTVNNSHQL